MQNFTKKQMALAIGAALATAAGSAVAANSTQSLLNKVLVVPGAGFAAGTEGKALYTAAGVNNGKISLRLVITSDGVNADTVSNINFGADTTGAAAVVADPTVGIDLGTAAGDTVNNFLIVATDGTTTINLASKIDSAGGTVPPVFTPGVGRYTVDMNVDSTTLVAGDRFRIDSTGALQYSADAGVTFLPVKVSLQNIGDSNGFYVDAGDDSINTAADSSNTLKTFAANSAFTAHTIVPTAELATRADTAIAAAPGSLVNGATLNTFGSLTALAASNLKVMSRGTLDTLIGSVAIDTVNGALTTSGSANSFTITFSPAATNLDTADTTADADLYTAKGFNTGIAAGNTPFTVDAASADSLAAVFTTVFLATGDSTFGTAASLLANGSAGTGVKFAGANVITDGAQPVLTGSTFNSNTKTLTLSFSEPIVDNGNDGVDSPDDILAAIENVSFGAAPGTTLAAANFNTGGDVDSVTITNANGIGTLNLGTSIDSLSGTSAFLNQPVLINKRISVTEPGEAANSVVDTTLDTFGFKSLGNNEILAHTGTTHTISVAPTQVTLNFDEETKAVAVMASGGSNVEKIEITYPFNVSVDSTADVKDHFKLTVFDGANGATVSPDPHSLFLQSGVTASGKVVTITLTAQQQLLLKNMSGLDVQYNTAWGDGKAALKFSDSASSTNGIITGGTIDTNEINLPFFLTVGQAPLYTMEASMDLEGVTGNSKVTGYLAKWLDTKVDNTFAASGIKIVSGRASNPNDRVATDLSLEIDATADTVSDTTGNTSFLQNAIASELNKAKPALIPVVIELQRSNDLPARGANGTDADWLGAHARIALNRGDAIGAGGSSKDALYDVLLDPRSGAISGRIVGLLRMTQTKGTKAARGLVFLDNKGNFVDSASGAAQTSVATDGNGKAKLIIGVDATPTTLPNLAGSFVLAVHTDLADQANPVLITSAEPGMRNFLPFEANLITLRDGRTGLGGKDSAGVVAKVDASLIKPVSKLAASTAWQLVGVGSLDRRANAPAIAPRDLPRLFTSLNSLGEPQTDWTGAGDGATGDLALTMLGNRTGVASEATSGDTVSTIALGANASPVRFAFAFSNDQAEANKFFFLTKAATATSLPVGWSLINAPSSWAAAGGVPSTISHVLKVGAGYSAVSTFVRGTNDDGTTSPAGLVAADEPVFVFSRSATTVQ